MQPHFNIVMMDKQAALPVSMFWLAQEEPGSYLALLTHPWLAEDQIYGGFTTTAAMASE